MATSAKTIVIHLNESSGEITIEPYGIYLLDGERVRFETDGHVFKLAFHDGSPFGGKEISKENPVGLLRPAVPKGHYTYAVAVVSKDGRDVFLEADCPSIIVH